MSKVEVKVDKIRSYQTLVNKRGYNSYRTKEYKAYIQEISYQLMPLKAVERNTEVRIDIHYKHKNKVRPDIDNATKPILDILQMSGKLHNDRNVTQMSLKQTFGHDENTIVIKMEEL